MMSLPAISPLKKCKDRAYAEDGSNRRENITDWALGQFQAKYGQEVSKWDIFHYVYAMLHHPRYRERYGENLKRDLPRIPLLVGKSEFELCVRVGKRLMELHVGYEEVMEYPLRWVENKDVPISWHVEKMKLLPGKDTLVVNEWLTLTGIPQECFAYRLGNRSALEWVIDQYQVSTDARSGIVSDPNSLDDEQYIVRLVRICFFAHIALTRSLSFAASAWRLVFSKRTM